MKLWDHYNLIHLFKNLNTVAASQPSGMALRDNTASQSVGPTIRTELTEKMLNIIMIFQVPRR